MIQLACYDFIREAGLLAASFITEGYIQRTHSWNELSHTAFWALVHCRNGNRITITASADGYVVKKNHKIIKTVR